MSRTFYQIYQLQNSWTGVTRSGFPREDKTSDGYLKVQVPQAHTSPEVHDTQSTGISNAKLFTFVCMARAWLKLHLLRSTNKHNFITWPLISGSHTRLILSCFSSSGLLIFRMRNSIYLHFTLSGSSEDAFIRSATPGLQLMWEWD